jgi:hypothetical protein
MFEPDEISEGERGGNSVVSVVELLVLVLRPSQGCSELIVDVLE